MGRSALHGEIRKAALSGYPYYVYSLSDAGGEFYVGKGKGYRVFEHGSRCDTCNPEKSARIAQVGRDGVTRTVLAYFSDEYAAYAHERALIAENAAHLTNITHGFDDPRARASHSALEMLKRVRPFAEWHPLTPAWLFKSIVDALVREVEDPTPPYFIRQEDGKFAPSWKPWCAA